VGIELTLSKKYRMTITLKTFFIMILPGNYFRKKNVLKKIGAIPGKQGRLKPQMRSFI